MSRHKHFESRLPAWAQERLADLRQEIASLKTAIADRDAEHPPSDVAIWDDYAEDRLRYLPAYSRVRFFSRAAPQQSLRYVDVYTDDEGYIVVNAGRAVAIEPRASNHFALVLR